MTDFTEHDKARSLTPEDPEDEGVEVAQPPITKVEPVHLLANEARHDLRQAGFDDDQIDDWARAYFGSHTSGSADEFIDWVWSQEHTASRRSS